MPFPSYFPTKGLLEPGALKVHAGGLLNLEGEHNGEMFAALLSLSYDYD